MARSTGNNLKTTTEYGILRKTRRIPQEGGFCPEKTDFGLQFKYETLDFIHFRDDQDENFLNLFFPQIFEVTEETVQTFMLR